MEKPTIEQYNKAKENFKTYTEWVEKSRNRQAELIDELASVRSDEKTYLKELEKYKEVILMYETFERFENANNI